MMILEIHDKKSWFKARKMTIVVKLREILDFAFTRQDSFLRNFTKWGKLCNFYYTVQGYIWGMYVRYVLHEQELFILHRSHKNSDLHLLPTITLCCNLKRYQKIWTIFIMVIFCYYIVCLRESLLPFLGVGLAKLLWWRCKFLSHPVVYGCWRCSWECFDLKERLSSKGI